MPWQLIVIGAAGVSVGSFINVLIARFGAAGARLTDRSHCVSCLKQLRWWELVPLISFLALRGRCASCRQPISWRYPVIEAVTGAAWVWAFISSSHLLAALSLAGIFTVLILLWAIDAQHLLLPDIYLVYLGLFVILHLWVTAAAAPRSALLGVIVGCGTLAAIWAATSGRGLGFGDVKLVLPLGLLLGGAGMVTVLFLAFMAGGVSAGYLLATRQAGLKSAVPFGPYLIAAACAVLLSPRLITVLFALLPA